MQKPCAQCGTGFEITDSDLQFYSEISPTFAGKRFQMPPPTLCPDCRQQRRVAMANQINLFERKCDLTGATIISNFHPDSPYKVYRSEDWYSDRWDPLAYARDFDFSRPFFEQFQELSLAVPRPQLHKAFEFDENADYTNYAGRNKNCYLIFDSEDNRDCYYCYSINATESCMECFRIRTGELLYGCIDCVKCYHSSFAQDCENCSDCVFIKNCIGCKHCLMCSNLKNKEFYVENRPVSREQFEEFRSFLSSSSRLQSAKERFEKLKLEYPQKYMHGVQNENVVGDYLTSCKNADHCFDSPDLWDCKYVHQAFGWLKNCMDIQETGEGERMFESAFCGYNTFNLCFSVHSLGGQTDMYYCMHSPHSKNLFGCVGCRHKQYCIFNKQYSEEEYGRLAMKIVEHMIATKEFGEFFPISLSVFPYNLTLAQDYFPLERGEALKRGWSWLDEEKKQDKYLGPEVEVPDDINDVDESLCEKILRCETTPLRSLRSYEGQAPLRPAGGVHPERSRGAGLCGKLYKIIPQELRLYQKMNLPLPRKCFQCRHRERFAARNPRPLHDRTCDKCGVPFKTTYAPDRSAIRGSEEPSGSRGETVFCERCYLESLE